MYIVYVSCTFDHLITNQGESGEAMSRTKSSARIVKWRDDFYLFFHDHTAGKQRRVLCASLGATNAATRNELVKKYRLQEKLDETEVVRRGGRIAFDTNLVTAIGIYLKDCKDRVAARQVNPKARVGLSEKSGEMIEMTVRNFVDWLEREGYGSVTTGQLDSPLLSAYFQSLSGELTRKGNAIVRRSAATLNIYRRYLKTCLGYLDDIRPPLFPDFKALKKALKPQRVDPKNPKAFPPQDLQAFLGAAIEWESPEVKVAVSRRKVGGKKEAYGQGPPHRPATPISRLFLLLALTGCRLGEALNLKWEDVDLQRGRVTIHAQKTGRTRVLPLVGAPEGDVAPGLLKLLKGWRKDEPEAVFVLPHEGVDAPILSKSAWQTVNRRAGLKRIGPQMLRQNFTSYAASLGVPSLVAALWQGHSSDVAERHYRAQVLDRIDADSIEGAMGLAIAGAGKQ